MNTILKPRGTIKVSRSSRYLSDTRGVNVGDIIPHFGTGESSESHKKKFYLIMPNGKPYVLYFDEVELVS